MTLGMLGVLLELYSPGHGVPLIVGLSCLALFFFGHHVARLAGWEEMVLFGVGAALIAVEVFAPGHIFPAVIGSLLIVAALIMAVVNLDRIPAEVAWDAGWLPRAVATVFGSIAATAALAAGAGRLLPRTRIGRRLILDAAIRAVATPPAAGADDEASLAGQVGSAATDLRPSGKVTLGGRRVDAVAERGYIDAGARVRVVRAGAGRIVVRQIEREEG
jgi:membrane-bound serine protease (ClpP class)